MKTRRREMLIGATAAVASAGSLPAPAVAQGIKEFKLVSGYPRDLPGSGASPERLAQSIATMSDGRLKVTVYPPDTLVRALEVFDAVSAGVADMYFTDEKYFQNKAPALNFFSTVPYGLTTDEFHAWILFGGGQGLWDEVGAQFNIKSLMLQNTGVQMGGWFTKEINTPEDFKGLRYRMPELGAEVPRRMGATVVLIPVGEVADALKSGAIDAVYATRFKRMRESIEAMKEVWTKAEAEYHGEFVNFDPMIARPKPVQKPHPPIHVGGAFPYGARRAIRYGDGWIPTARGDVTGVLPKFREMAREAGRDPASIEITSFGLGEDLDRVKRLAEMGVARVVPMFPPEKADTVLPIVDRWTKIMRQVNR
jgi:hypothetical protein